MKFRQARSIYKATFDFGPDALDYTFSSYRNRRGGSAPYEQIPPLWKTALRKHWQTKYVAVAIVLGGIVVGARIMARYSAAAPEARQGGLVYIGVALVVGIVLYAVDRLAYRTVEVTVIPGKPDICIIADGQQQAIADEILKRRREALRSKLGKVDVLNGVGAESRKFRWLREEEVISEQEYAEAAVKLSGVLPDDAPTSRAADPRMLH